MFVGFVLILSAAFFVGWEKIFKFCDFNLDK